MSAAEDAHGPLARRAIEARDTVDYQTEQTLDCVTEAIVDRMAELGLTRRDLSALIGVSPARITMLLRGSNNFTVRTLVEVSRALECDLSVTLIPHGVDSPAGFRLSPTGSDPAVATETRTEYRVPTQRLAYGSRDDEIRAHLASGKLKVEGERVCMRHESDGTYRPSKFRKAGTHSTMEKTNVGRRAYYRDRIIAVARDGRDRTDSP